MAATPPTVVSLKQSFLTTQTRLLSQPLTPTRAWRTSNSDDPSVALPEKAIDDALFKLNHHLQQHARRVYAPQATRHVAEQIDQLYWNAAEAATQGDRGYLDGDEDGDGEGLGVSLSADLGMYPPFNPKTNPPTPAFPPAGLQPYQKPQTGVGVGCMLNRCSGPNRDCHPPLRMGPSRTLLLLLLLLTPARSKALRRARRGPARPRRAEAAGRGARRPAPEDAHATGALWP